MTLASNGGKDWNKLKRMQGIQWRRGGWPEYREAGMRAGYPPDQELSFD